MMLYFYVACHEKIDDVVLFRGMPRRNTVLPVACHVKVHFFRGMPRKNTRSSKVASDDAPPAKAREARSVDDLPVLVHNLQILVPIACEARAERARNAPARSTRASHATGAENGKLLTETCRARLGCCGAVRTQLVR